MNVKIPYGKDFVDLDVTIPHEVLSPNEPEVGDESSIILEALSDPVEKEPFEEFANNADKILVIVNDATRPTPTARVLEEVQDTLRSHPDVKFIVATGAHRGPTEDEFRFIFGNLY
ncbi:MAG: DUF2088 domain-containing protein, partial [Methanococcoides sp.]|nr:DUF2088 domain-containing protein [Methanococcoides sp.]